MAVTRLPASRVPDPRDAPPLRWGILAPGGIAHGFARALREHTRQDLAAVGSRSAARATAFARTFGVERAHGSYEALVEDPAVDVVYVASPHSEHLDHALLAVAAGKHVLVEKAFTRNAAEAERLVAAARERGVFCLEAMWTRFLPHVDIVRQLLETGALGDVHAVIADHGQIFAPDPRHRLFAPELAGGALLDLGVYPLSFASMVLGSFTSLTAVGTAAFTGVDASVSVVVTNGAGAHGSITTTLSARTPTVASVSGTLGRVELDGRFFAPTTVRLFDAAGAHADTVAPAQREGGLAFEAAEVARCIAEGRRESPLLPLDETLRVMRALDDARAQVGVRLPGE